MSRYRLMQISFIIGRIAFYAVLFSYWPLVFIAFNQDVIALKIYVAVMGFGTMGAIPFGLYFYMDTMLDDIDRLFK